MENQLPRVRVLYTKPNPKRVTLTLYKEGPVGVQQSRKGIKIAVFYSAGRGNATAADLAYDFALQMRDKYPGYHSIEIV